MITNTSKIYTSNVSANSVLTGAISTLACNVSNIYSSIITTGDINVDDITVIDNERFRMKAGSNYGELKTNSANFNISCSNALYLSLSNNNKEKKYI